MNVEYEVELSGNEETPCHSDQGKFLTSQLDHQPFWRPYYICSPYLMLGVSMGSMGPMMAGL